MDVSWEGNDPGPELVARLALRQGPPWRSLAYGARCWRASWAVSGQYTSPIWMARVLAATSHWPFSRDLADEGRPARSSRTTSRSGSMGYLRDGDASFYWWMTVVLPGFRQFRFPAKLFTFTALGLAALAGIGWDGLCVPTAPGELLCCSLAVLVLSLAVLGTEFGLPGLPF